MRTSRPEKTEGHVQADLHPSLLISVGLDVDGRP